eukprot:1256385-Prymnesium_polylepis.1
MGGADLMSAVSVYGDRIGVRFPVTCYDALVESTALQGWGERSQGSGTKTVLMSTCVAWTHQGVERYA